MFLIATNVSILVRVQTAFEQMIRQNTVGSLEDEFYVLLATTPDINPHAFENNWPYIVQATRNGFHVFRDADAIVYYTHRYHGDPQSKTVVVHALGNGRHAAVVKFAQHEANQGRSTLIKNIPSEDVSWWKDLGFRYPAEHWDEYNLYDDNTFPQYVSSVQYIYDLKCKRDHRKAVHQFARRRNIETSLYEDRYEADARGLLEMFARHLQEKGSASYIEAVRAHDFFFARSIVRKVRLQHVENGVLVGCSFFTPVNAIVYYNALMNTSEDDIQKYLAHEAKMWVIRNYPHVTHIVDQGSERPGQDWMKQRSSEQKIGDKVHLEYKA